MVFLSAVPAVYHLNSRTYFKAPEGDEMEKLKVHYSDLGLSNTNEMFAKAMAGKYAIPLQFQ